jgi:hypothetical protein
MISPDNRGHQVLTADNPGHVGSVSQKNGGWNRSSNLKRVQKSYELPRLLGMVLHQL